MIYNFSGSDLHNKLNCTEPHLVDNFLKYTLRDDLTFEEMMKRDTNFKYSVGHYSYFDVLDLRKKYPELYEKFSPYKKVNNNFEYAYPRIHNILLSENFDEIKARICMNELNKREIILTHKGFIEILNGLKKIGVDVKPKQIYEMIDKLKDEYIDHDPYLVTPEKLISYYEPKYSISKKFISTEPKIIEDNDVIFEEDSFVRQECKNINDAINIEEFKQKYPYHFNAGKLNIDNNYVSDYDAAIEGTRLLMMRDLYRDFKNIEGSIIAKEIAKANKTLNFKEFTEVVNSVNETFETFSRFKIPAIIEKAINNSYLVKDLIYKTDTNHILPKLVKYDNIQQAVDNYNLENLDYRWCHRNTKNDQKILEYFGVESVEDLFNMLDKNKENFENYEEKKSFFHDTHNVFNWGSDDCKSIIKNADDFFKSVAIVDNRENLDLNKILLSIGLQELNENKITEEKLSKLKAYIESKPENFSDVKKFVQNNLVIHNELNNDLKM